MAAFQFGCDPGNESGGGMREFLSPGHVDEQIRQAIQICWMMLPPERQTVEEVESQIRRLVDRALQNLREDHQQFRG